MVGKSPKLVSIDGGSSAMRIIYLLLTWHSFPITSYFFKKVWYKLFRRSLITMENQILTCNMPWILWVQNRTWFSTKWAIFHRVCVIPSRHLVETNWPQSLLIGASFNNFLDALDGDYCSFEGGDDPIQDASYPDKYSNGYHSESRTCSNIIECNPLLPKMLPIVELQSLLMSFRLRMGITRQIFPRSILLDNALSTKPIQFSNQPRSCRVQICQARINGGHSYFFIRW